MDLNTLDKVHSDTPEKYIYSLAYFTSPSELATVLPTEAADSKPALLGCCLVNTCKIVQHTSPRQDAPILRSLARTAACSGETSGTVSDLRGQPRRPPSCAVHGAAACQSAGLDAFAVRSPLLTAP